MLNVNHSKVNSKTNKEVKSLWLSLIILVEVALYTKVY